MKKVITSFLLFVLIGGVFSSCKKKVESIEFEGGTPPVFTIENLYSQSDTLILNLEDSALPCLNLYWTNPDYKFTTGVSSQNVTYTFQIDSAGADFFNAKKDAFSVNNDLSRALTVKDLNTYVSNLNLQDTSIIHKLDLRIMSSLLNSSIPLFSNVINLFVKPYSPAVPTLYITGTATGSGWVNNPPPDQKFTYIPSTGKFEITMNFQPSKAYKFLSVWGQWQPQYGGCGASGGDLKVNDGTGSDPVEIPTPAVAGTYKITVDLNALTCVIE